MVLHRRRLLLGASLLSIGVLRASKSSSQVAGLSKMAWDTIFAGLSLAVQIIPPLIDWLSGESSEAKSALCNFSIAKINDLEFRCFAVSLALDSTGAGPVVPPKDGNTGIIPALAAFAVRQDQETVAVTRDACFRILDASENLLSELDRGKWITLLHPAGLKTEDIATLSENLKYASPRMSEFLWVYNANFPVTTYDVEAARRLLKQLVEIPESAERASAAIQRIREKRQKTSCPP